MLLDREDGRKGVIDDVKHTKALKRLSIILILVAILTLPHLDETLLSIELREIVKAVVLRVELIWVSRAVNA